MRKLAFLLAGAAWLHAQDLDPAALLKPSTDTWPSYNGDYTGRRYSTLSQINQSNAGSLAMEWAFQTMRGRCRHVDTFDPHRSRSRRRFPRHGAPVYSNPVHA